MLTNEKTNTHIHEIRNNTFFSAIVNEIFQHVVTILLHK